MIRTLFATLLATALVAADPLAPGTAAPDFTLPDATGANVSLASFKGKTVVLEWVNYDCPFVKKHYASDNLPGMQAAWKAKGVVWLSICSSAAGKQGSFSGAELTARITAEKAVPSHYLIDAAGSVGRTYGAQTTPQIAVIDATGVIRYHGAIDSIRSADQADIAKATNLTNEALTAVLAGTTVATPRSAPYGCGVKYGK
jgi:peroxiredoxin